ncbi:hypothetical protein KRR39_11695 [Nocardioides panacis]|uniref:DUF2567 domain-containing protein n=1 Tax=Nocardioides panacis TaxID=2849501 RepID=A0A975T2I9_9ACTN|nr:hypothetical protein [Nocardioides panacis]QWZ10321.1 hypothetical protein KRR39_11695 [Nocardioides panacis]
MAGSPRSPASGRDVAVVLGVLVALGVLCGVLWWLLWDPAAYTKTADGGVMGETDLSRRFAADGLYAVIAGVAGLLSGLGLTWWRTRDPLLTSAALLVGSVLAAVVMALTGHLLGPGDPGAALAAAKVGARVPERLGVDAFTVYLAWPVAVLAGALVVLLGTAPVRAVGPADESPTDAGARHHEGRPDGAPESSARTPEAR